MNRRGGSPTYSPHLRKNMVIHRSPGEQQKILAQSSPVLIECLGLIVRLKPPKGMKMLQPIPGLLTEDGIGPVSQDEQQKTQSVQAWRVQNSGRSREGTLRQRLAAERSGWKGRRKRHR
ncbi:hypothetical protein VTN00DRAFT_4330 [Thermoascus crustaceus]|uniref:uncharacterized protein n=1 Tax=Thermoascus crustaceus TaxID=5088 RepID=UPI0037424F3B